MGSFIPESAASAKAYYTAIDPNNTKPTFTKWLVNAGFIANEGQWHSSGAQNIVIGQPAGVYGDNVINADSHVIVLNASDLGFVRDQFIRCKPSCSALSPIIYTYLENYPVNPFAASGNGGSGFPIRTGYPTQDEAAAAINSAVNRPLGDLPGCSPANTDTPFGCSIQRIADVAFEWAPPADGSSPTTRFGQQYAYVFFRDKNTGMITETMVWLEEEA